MQRPVLKLRYGISTGTKTGINIGTNTMENGTIPGDILGDTHGSTTINTKPVQLKQHQVAVLLVIHQVVKQIHSATQN